MTGDPVTGDPEIGLARSASQEWADLVTAAVLGTDRRPLHAARPGWSSLIPTDDPAIELLHRAAGLATARRAGARPGPVPARLVPAPFDPRPSCPPAAAAQLARMLAGQHDVLLPEWFARCRSAGYQLPLHLLPALLLRGRRNPAFDVAVRSVAGPRAAWLAEAMPELRIKSVASTIAAGGDPFLPPAPPPDSAAIVSAIVGTFHDHTATWAAAPQIRIAVASIEARWLSTLILELNRAPFHSMTERTRVDLLGVAHLRSEMIASMSVPASTSAVPLHGA